MTIKLLGRPYSSLRGAEQTQLDNPTIRGGYVVNRSTCIATPGQPLLTNLAMWIDASDITRMSVTGSVVHQIGDKSGNNRNFNGTAILASGSIGNGNLYVTFTTAQSMFNAANFTGADCTVLIVSAWQSLGGSGRGRILVGYNNNWLLGFYNNLHPSFFFAGTGPYGLDNISDSKFHQHSMWAKITGTQASAWEDGTNIGGTVTGVPPNGVAINVSNSFPETCGCALGEFLVYSAALSDSDRQSVEKYLYNKWATPQLTNP